MLSLLKSANPDRLEKWLTALETQPKQCFGDYRDYEGGYDAIGTGIALLEPTPVRFQSWLFFQWLGVDPLLHSELVELNDIRRLSLREIAQEIRNATSAHHRR